MKLSSTSRIAPHTSSTAERQPNPDQSWYACFVKDGGKPIVVIVTVERGGFGADTAAPIARLILSQYFDVKKQDYPFDRTHDWSDELNGVTHDADHWYITQKHRLWRFPVGHDLGSPSTTGAVSVGGVPVTAGCCICMASTLRDCAAVRCCWTIGTAVAATCRRAGTSPPLA